MRSGQALWRQAKELIPGGGMLLSKRAEMFLPNQWPSYFSRSSGCHVWDLDGNRLVDMSLMGVGTNILGYAHPTVDAAVIGAVRAGISSTLNCPEDVYLAEKLLEIHPWAQMARFTRSGGEAAAVAVRIARAASGRGDVAMCGYHGWHDWYLSANLAENDALDGHLLSGLAPKGVPRSLLGTVHAFNFGHLQRVEQIVNEHDIGTIIMEVSRSADPDREFLQDVRDLCSRRGIVLIFDECTSGFRESLGGLHMNLGIDPDLVILGKALGNGYAIAAILGTEAVMQAAQDTFISSTFWTERIGPVAALATLGVMEQSQSWNQITTIGQDIRVRWQALADTYGLSIRHSGLSALPSFSFEGNNALAYKTLITQEMLVHGFLATTSVYVSVAHDVNTVDAYFEKLETVFRLIRECEDGLDVYSMLTGPVCHAGFKRLN